MAEEKNTICMAESEYFGDGLPIGKQSSSTAAFGVVVPPLHWDLVIVF